MGLAVILATLDRSILSLLVALGGPWAMGWHMTWQLSKLDTNDTQSLLSLFRSNRMAGLIPLPFFAVSYLL